MDCYQNEYIPLPGPTICMRLHEDCTASVSLTAVIIIKMFIRHLGRKRIQMQVQIQNKN